MNKKLTSILLATLILNGTTGFAQTKALDNEKASNVTPAKSIPKKYIAMGVAGGVAAVGLSVALIHHLCSESEPSDIAALRKSVIDLFHKDKETVAKIQKVQINPYARDEDIEAIQCLRESFTSLNKNGDLNIQKLQNKLNISLGKVVVLDTEICNKLIIKVTMPEKKMAAKTEEPAATTKDETTTEEPAAKTKDKTTTEVPTAKTKDKTTTEVPAAKTKDKTTTKEPTATKNETTTEVPAAATKDKTTTEVPAKTTKVEKTTKTKSAKKDDTQPEETASKQKAANKIKDLMKKLESLKFDDTDKSLETAKATFEQLKKEASTLLKQAKTLGVSTENLTKALEKVQKNIDEAEKRTESSSSSKNKKSEPAKAATESSSKDQKSKPKKAESSRSSSSKKSNARKTKQEKIEEINAKIEDLKHKLTDLCVRMYGDGSCDDLENHKTEFENLKKETQNIGAQARTLGVSTEELAQNLENAKQSLDGQIALKARLDAETAKNPKPEDKPQPESKPQKKRYWFNPLGWFGL